MNFKILEHQQSPKLYILIKIDTIPKRICTFGKEYLNVMTDVCDFLNDKYCDKEINEEWANINKEEYRKIRILYHINQLLLLCNTDLVIHWNDHGNKVESGW